MDFYRIVDRKVAKNTGTGKRDHFVEVVPEFFVTRSKDLMVRAKGFYAIWDEDRTVWSTDEYDVQRLVDKELLEYRENEIPGDVDVVIRFLRNFSTKSWSQFRDYMRDISDNYHTLDDTLTFKNSEVKRDDYVSKRLSYPLEEGTTSAWDELTSTILDEEERQKIEWAIGSIVSGDSKKIQKFVVLFGEAGGGKSTILNVIQKLFEGYYTTFDAKALTENSNSFSTEAFKGNPLVAIQHDGDLSRIENNTLLNSIVSHEEIIINEKFKPSYSSRSNCLLFMGTNKAVRITDAKSGVIRRLIDVRTSGRKIPQERYKVLMTQIDFELGAIANKCLQQYRKMGKHYYDSYRPLDMMYQTDIFFNFVESHFGIFKMEETISLQRAYDLYKEFCKESNVEFVLPRHRFREELKSYFENYYDRTRINEKQVRSIYSGFKADKFTSVFSPKEEEPVISLSLDSDKCIFDELAADYPAQYAKETDQSPEQAWRYVKTTLKDLDTSRMHYVKLPENHIVIDFDLKNEAGEKSAQRNLEEASQWPPTYAEFSKSRKGVHLHYIYDGDPKKLARAYSEGIEIKVFTGDSSLRRQFTKCNEIPIAHINGGLPLKGETVLDKKAVMSEKALRDLIVRNMNKEFHPGTKPSVDFIFKILEDAYASGMKYDLTTLRPKVLAFALGSNNHAEYCAKVVSKMRFQSKEEETPNIEANDDLPIVFYDVEVFSNLFVISWKHQGPKKTCVSMINPTPAQVEKLFSMKLVGFNNRRYDNHILYARYLGYSNEELFELSKRIVGNSNNGYFREAYNLSYADVYDFSSIKQGLKKWQIDLGIHHKEIGIPWDQPVPEDMWLEVAKYCENDVVSTEAVFEDRKQDFVARQILAELSGLTVNDTTQTHTARIIFGNDPKPQNQFVYTDLSEMFPGYKFENGVSTYRGVTVGEGGYVYAEPGIYQNVALLDVASMHPTSIEALNLFGKYTATFSELKSARIAIKHKDFESAKGLLNGMLAKYLTSEEQAEPLAYALKIVINIVYGLTSASFDNKFRDPRNVDNIVAKRGALFMIDLQHAVQEQGYSVAHIKTDSIKIPNADSKIIEFVFAFGQKYGYTFEHEATFDKFALVNDAVYIAKYKDGKKAGKWSATGAEFAHPYVFKSIFSHEKITFDDMCEAKSVTSPAALYLDMNEGMPEGEHNYKFVGRVGLFCPIISGAGGGVLVREKDGKYYAATGTKGYRWLEAEVVMELDLQDKIDSSYHESLVSKAIDHISKFGDFDWFVSE